MGDGWVFKRSGEYIVCWVWSRRRCTYRHKSEVGIATGCCNEL